MDIRSAMLSVQNNDPIRMYRQCAKGGDEAPSIRRNLAPLHFGHAAGGLSHLTFYSFSLASELGDYRFVNPQLRADLNPIAGRANRRAVSGFFRACAFERGAARKASMAVLGARLARRHPRLGPGQRLNPQPARARRVMQLADYGCVRSIHCAQLFLICYNLSREGDQGF